MNEHYVENGHEIDIAKLQAGHAPIEEYSTAHRTVSIVCHDVVVRMRDKYLLIERDNVPAKGILWPLGGRVARGISAEESLKDKVFREAGIEITNIKFLGVARTLFETDPFGHGKGTDTVNLMYLADGQGEIKLDELHKSPTLFIREEYHERLRSNLHPYVIEIMDKALVA